MSLKCQIFYEEIIVFLILSENDNKIMCQKMIEYNMDFVH